MLEEKSKIVNFDYALGYNDALNDLVKELNNIFSWRHDIQDISDIAVKMRKTLPLDSSFDSK